MASQEKAYNNINLSQQDIIWDERVAVNDIFKQKNNESISYEKIEDRQSFTAEEYLYDRDEFLYKIKSMIKLELSKHDLGKHDLSKHNQSHHQRKVALVPVAPLT